MQRQLGVQQKSRRDDISVARKQADAIKKSRMVFLSYTNNLFLAVRNDDRGLRRHIPASDTDISLLRIWTYPCHGYGHIPAADMDISLPRINRNSAIVNQQLKILKISRTLW
jgi:hypothetical protein